MNFLSLFLPAYINWNGSWSAVPQADTVVSRHAKTAAFKAGTFKFQVHIRLCVVNCSHQVVRCELITAPSMLNKQVSSRTRPLQAKLGMHAKLS
jgi:hypothetical protein